MAEINDLVNSDKPAMSYHAARAIKPTRTPLVSPGGRYSPLSMRRSPDEFIYEVGPTGL
jgi:hypothetical protein